MERLITREEADTNPDFGSSPKARSIIDHIKNGFVVIDKPDGPTSHQVSAWTRDIFKPVGVAKAGHIGTLDPHVSGVLPILLHNAVKIAPAFQHARKEYVCLMRLHKEVEDDDIRKTAASFVGKVRQLPPKIAAVKRVQRVREVFYLDILEIRSGREVLFKIGVESGFYVRTLCADWGKALRVRANMQELRRTRAGQFSEDDLSTLNDLRDAFEFWRESKDERGLREIVRPLEEGTARLKKIFVKDSAVSAVAYGAPLRVGGVSKLSEGIMPGELVAVMSLKGELVALGKSALSSREMAEKKAGLAAQISRGVISRDVYPREWRRS